MAYAKITRQWPDESASVMEVGCEESFPDAIAEVTAAVARLDREVYAEDESSE